eukprot:scaffold3460_cov115-Isochrysis_galbana.AAC.4
MHVLACRPGLPHPLHSLGHSFHLWPLHREQARHLGLPLARRARSRHRESGEDVSPSLPSPPEAILNDALQDVNDGHGLRLAHLGLGDGTAGRLAVVDVLREELVEAIRTRETREGSLASRAAEDLRQITPPSELKHRPPFGNLLPPELDELVPRLAVPRDNVAVRQEHTVLESLVLHTQHSLETHRHRRLVGEPVDPVPAIDVLVQILLSPQG